MLLQKSSDLVESVFGLNKIINNYCTNWYEEKVYSILCKAKFDPEEVNNKFSSIKFDKNIPRIPLHKYAERISSKNCDYVDGDLVSAYQHLSQEDVKILRFHPSCIGNDSGPVSIYTRKDSRITRMIIQHTSFCE